MTHLLDKIYNYAFKIILIKPRTESELRQKIGGKFKDAETEIIEEVIEKLKELKYIDDTKYIQDYVEYRSSISPRGIFLLKQELRQKGIASDLIGEVMNTIEVDEIALVKKLAENKSRSLQSFEPQKRKEKMIRFLQSRGFSYGVIKEII